MVEGVRKPFIVGLGHRRRVGKDTFGGMLQDYLRGLSQNQVDVRTGAFADKLKSVCHELYGWAGVKGRQWYEDHPEERERFLPGIGMSPRELWIRFGTNAVRNQVYQDTWVDALLRGVSCDVLIVTDVRFPGEASKIREMGGVLIRVDNPMLIPSDDVADCALDDWGHWDHLVVNNGTIDDLRRTAMKTAECLIPVIHGLKVSAR